MTQTKLLLPSELTIVQVEEYKAQVLEALSDINEITIEDKQLARIDTIGVQFLLALLTYLEAQQIKVHWENVSSIVKESIKQLGINDPLFDHYINV